MGFTDSFKKVIGLSDLTDDDYVTEEELRGESKKVEREEKKARKKEPVTTDYYASTPTSRAQSYGGGGRAASEIKTSDKKFTNANGDPLKLVLIEPRSYDDAQKLVDNLKQRKPVIINLEKLETDLARKIFDFLNGAIYALGGGVKKIANNIFIFTPNNVSVDAENQQYDGMHGHDGGQWG